MLVVSDSMNQAIRQVAVRIASEANADVELLVDRRSGVGDWLRSHLGARERFAQLAPLRLDVTDYDLLIVGTPARGAAVSPATRSYLAAVREQIEHVAFFCTHSDGELGSVDALREMETLSGRVPAVSLVLRDSEVKRGGFDPKVRAFVAAACRATSIAPPASGRLSSRPPMAIGVLARAS